MSLQYWQGITEHTCGADFPIGGCLACFLQEVKHTVGLALSALEDDMERGLDRSYEIRELKRIGAGKE